MQRDYWYTRGARAGRPRPAGATWDARRRAHGAPARRAPAARTLECPVLFEAPEAADLIGCFVPRCPAAACTASRRSCSTRSAQQVFAPHVQMREEPHLRRGRGSAPFDGEGVATRARDVVRDGVLQGYFLGCYSARKLGMQTTGNAGGSHNLRARARRRRPRRRCSRRMGRGLLVTELLGPGREPGDRRLLARRRRLLGRERRDRLSGGGDHDRRQPEATCSATSSRSAATSTGAARATRLDPGRAHDGGRTLSRADAASRRDAAMIQPIAATGSGRSPIRCRAPTTPRAGSAQLPTDEAATLQKEALELVAASRARARRPGRARSRRCCASTGASSRSSRS